MTSGVDIDAAVEELSALARVRNRLELEPARFPVLVERAIALGIELPAVDAVFAVIERAIAGLDDGRRQAATCLLADGPDRWSQNLKTRSTAAAAHLGIGSYHTFRDRRSGSSPSDDLIAAVAAAVLELEPDGSVGETLGGPGDAAGESGVSTEQRPTEQGPTDVADAGTASISARAAGDGAASGGDVPDALPEPDEPSRRSRLPIIAAMLASVVVLVGGAVWLSSERDDSASNLANGNETNSEAAPAPTDAAVVSSVAVSSGDGSAEAGSDATSTASSTTEIASEDEVVFKEGTVGASEAIPVAGCDIPLGGSVTPTPDQGLVAEAIAAAVEAVGGIELTGCPMHSIERWQNLWVQAFDGERLDDGGLPPGSVLVDDAGLGVWVEEGVVSGYRSGMSGTLQFVSGTPVGFRTEGDVQILELSDGALVVAEVPANRAFWLAAEAADDWLAAGGVADGLGPPLTDPNFIDGRPEQHFRFGRIWGGSRAKRFSRW